MSIALNNFARRNFLRKFLPAFLLFVTLCPSAILAQRPLGTDVSHYQSAINWATVKNAGVTFAWAKATESDSITDAMFATHAAGAKAAGVYIGAYHFARPSQNPNLTGANSAETEANFFWGVASNYVKSGGTCLVPMLDWEDPNATVAAGFTVTQMSQWANQWCITVSNLARASGMTIKPIIYTGVWFSQPSATYPGLNTTVTVWPGWISAYPANPNVQGGGPSSSYPWSTWTIWQYASTNWSGGDSDVFNGTLAQLTNSLVIGGVAPPSLTAQPILHRAVDTGSNVLFSAAAAGTAPLFYQWRNNGVNLATATNATFNLTNAQVTNSGFYTVAVTNSSGSVTSTPVSLLVYPPQVTLFADNFDANTATNWIQNKSSSDTAVTFSFDYSTLNLGIPSAPNSTNGTTLGVQMKANLATTTVAAISLSPTNKIFTGDYRVRFDSWINVNGPFPAGGAGSTEFLTAGVGTSGARAEWTGNAAADGYYFSINGEGGSSDTATNTADVNGYSGANILRVENGIYWAGADVTARGNGNVYYTTALGAGAGAAAPAAQQVNYPQQSGSLNNGTFGLAWHDVIISRRGSTVDWVVDGVRFCTISNATFTASNVFIGFWDPFSSLSSNNIINFGLVDNVRVESPAVAPAFTLQPAAKTVALGTNTTFTAAASGLPAAQFQWRFNGTNILGATNTGYALAFVATTNAGNYSVTASNFMGVITSTNAALKLIAPAAAQFNPASLNLTGDALQIGFTGDAYWTYTIEVSTNLTDWNSFTNLNSTNGVFNFSTGSILGSPPQFFRARVGP